MSLWTKVQSLSSPSLQKVHSLYGDHFPIEVRYVLANWIEERVGEMDTPSTTPTGPIDPDNPTHEPYISAFVQSLISELESKAEAMVHQGDPYLIRVKLVNAAVGFRSRYTLDPLSLYRYIRHCLAIEAGLVAEEEESSSSSSSTFFNSAPLPPTQQTIPQLPLPLQSTSSNTNPHSSILSTLSTLKNRTLSTADLLRRLEQEQEAFALKCHDRQKLEGIIHLHRMQQQQSNQSPSNQQLQNLEKNFQEQKQRLEYELKQRINSLLQIKQDLETQIGGTVAELALLQSKILDEELTKWKREQQLAGNGAPLTNNLDTLQSWCEDLAELIWHNRHQLKEVERLRGGVPGGLNQGQNQQIIPQLQEKITQLLSSLVTSTFIVEKQPPQVMKTNTRFTSTVRLLVGGRLNVHMTPPQVRVGIISEGQANGLLRDGGGSGGGGAATSSSSKSKESGETSGEILNNTGTMEYHPGTRHLSVHFRNMQLKRIRRAEKKGTESVMDEKFCLHFQCQFTVGEKELIFKIWTLSLPVVVIVHGNQEPHAWATVTWDNAFGEPGRMPFAVPERVVWGRVGVALNVKFKSLTGRGLTEENLRFLEEKGFRCPTPSTPHPDHLTWSSFCKEPLPDRNFTFWEWFYAIMKLTREHLRGPWVDGSILGFVGRSRAEEMLSGCAPGTFLLRFSDSELGGVTIAWVHADQKVFSLAPFTSKDLATRSLADRIADIGHLLYLYPDIPKMSAFGKYCTPIGGGLLDGAGGPIQSGKGYVKPVLKTHIPGLLESSTPPPSASSSSSTMQHQQLQQQAHPLIDPSSPGTYYGGSPSPYSNQGDNSSQQMEMGGGGSGLVGGASGASFPPNSSTLMDPFMDMDSLEAYVEEFDLNLAIDSWMMSQGGQAGGQGQGQGGGIDQFLNNIKREGGEGN